MCGIVGLAYRSTLMAFRQKRRKTEREAVCGGAKALHGFYGGGADDGTGGGKRAERGGAGCKPRHVAHYYYCYITLDIF